MKGAGQLKATGNDRGCRKDPAIMAVLHTTAVRSVKTCMKLAVHETSIWEPMSLRSLYFTASHKSPARPLPSRGSPCPRPQQHKYCVLRFVGAFPLCSFLGRPPLAAGPSRPPRDPQAAAAVAGLRCGTRLQFTIRFSIDVHTN